MKRFLAIFLSAVLLCCGFLPTLAKETSFTDVSSGSWYYDVVMAMAEDGYLTGYPDGSFKPNQTISAAEFVTIVTRCGGLQETSSTTGSHWAAGKMQAALNSGWYDWDELPPTGELYDQPITRQLAVNILMRALLPDEKGDYNTESAKMADFSQLDGRYYDKVLAAYSCGVVQGDDSGSFHPKSSLTRAEACAIIQRAKRLMSGSESGSQQTTPSTQTTPATQTNTSSAQQQTATAISGGVSQNGWLQVKGTQLCNQDGTPVVLHGMSTHGIQWYSQYASKQAIANTAAYGANLFRVAMYTAEGGYLSNPETTKAAAFAAVDAAISQDMYVILDWHILSDGNPGQSVEQAKKFFAEASAKYKDQPAVIYEICNEPNGSVTWSKDIKPYAETIVSTIRANSPNSIILIGSGTWSQDIQDPASNPVSGTNLMYTCHFYAGTHGSWLRQRIDDAISKGIAIFISEWGTSAADGSGGVYLTESEQWLNFLAERKISWANWSLCDKNETSAALKSGTSAQKVWTDSDLTESGKFVFSHFK